MPTVSHKNNALRSQSFPNLENSQCHLIGYSETAVIGIHSQILSKEKSFVSNNLPFIEASGEETILESPSLSAQASVAVEASADIISFTHSPTYQSCGTNTHNLVDAGVNTAPLTVDICIGTEWAISSSSSSEDESEEKSKTEASPQTLGSSDTSPQGKGQHTATITEKESQSEGSVETPSQL